MGLGTNDLVELKGRYSTMGCAKERGVGSDA